MIPNVSSFTIDHTKLQPGIYIAREGKNFITFDLRMTAPNKEPAMSPAGYHSLEHLMATYFRNSEIADSVIACDAMACLTGFYLILDSNKGFTPYTIKPIVISCMNWILKQTEVPATTPETCGNYHLHSLEDAKYYAHKYLVSLKVAFHHTYKKLYIKTSDGKQFADS